MSYSKTPKTTSTSAPVFKEFFLPGQEAYIPEFIGGWKEAYTSPGTSPLAKMLSQITGEAAMRETAQQRRAISGTRGMTAPAKAKAMGKLGEVGISAMAKVPQDVWAAAKEILTQYALTPPTVASGTEAVSSGGGGSSYGCCFIFIQGEGELTQIVRQYRDEHYGSASNPISVGYKWMAQWLVPLMRKISLLQTVVRVVMTQPLTNYARWWYGECSFTFTGWLSQKFWPTLWKVIGRIKNAQTK